MPQELEDFLADSQFKASQQAVTVQEHQKLTSMQVQDQPGTENVVLVKQFGNETYVRSNSGYISDTDIEQNQSRMQHSRHAH